MSAALQRAEDLLSRPARFAERSRTIRKLDDLGVKLERGVASAARRWGPPAWQLAAQFSGLLFRVLRMVLKGTGTALLAVYDHREEIALVIVLLWRIGVLLASVIFLGFAAAVAVMMWCLAGLIVCVALFYGFARLVFAPMDFCMNGVSQAFGLAGAVMHASMGPIGVLAGAGRLLGTNQGAGLRGGR